MSENLEPVQNQSVGTSTLLKAVGSPLTVIAGFSALAEIAMVVALKTIDVQLQSTFIWFVMLFPPLLVLGFYLTLNFNSKVLYAPSDFRDEENYMNALGLFREQETDLERIEKTVEDAVLQVGTTVQRISGTGIAQNQKIQESLESLNDQLKAIGNNVSYARDRNLQAILNLEAQGDNPPINSLTKWNTDVVVVPINSNRHARWGDRVDLYARIINLTDREITLGGYGGGASYIKGGKFLGSKRLDIRTLPPRFVSQPKLVISLELNPDNFSERNSLVTANWGVTVPNEKRTSKEEVHYYSCEPAVWAIQILPS